MGVVGNIAGYWKHTGIRLLPIVYDLKNYRLHYLPRDLFAGLNVAFIAFPQAIIYAIMAGLPIEFGLYGACLASFASACFAGSHVLNMGPTNASAIVLLSAFAASGIVSNQFVELLPMVLVITGLFLIISALVNIASLVQYVSRSVILGYMFALLIMMMVNQIHHALGYPIVVHNRFGATFLDTAIATFANIWQFDFSSLLVCLLVCTLFQLWRLILPRGPVIALTVLSLAFISFVLIKCFHLTNLNVLHVVRIHDWKPTIHGFNFEALSVAAEIAFVLTFVCLIDGATILKTLSARMGKRCFVNQMAFGLGLANIFCGLGAGMPASCSLTRSTANYLSGAATAFSSLFCGLFCLLGIFIFGPLFNYLPKPGLSMLIILLSFRLFDVRSLKLIFKTSPSDLFVFSLTFLLSFMVPLNISILLGVISSIALFLNKAAQPSFSEYVYTGEALNPIALGAGDVQSEISVVHIEGNLFFGSADLLLGQIRLVCKRPTIKVIILKLRGVLYIDATCLLAMEELLRYMKAHNRQLLLTEVSEAAFEILQLAGFIDKIGTDHVFKDDKLQTHKALTDALHYAKELIGHGKITVRVLSKPIVDVPAAEPLDPNVSLHERSVRLGPK